MFVLNIIAEGLLPVVVALATGALIGTLAGEPAAIVPGADSPGAALGVIAAALVLDLVILRFVSPAIEVLAHRVDLVVRERVLRAVLAPATLAHLEDPELADEFSLARSVGTEGYPTSATLVSLSTVATARVLGLGSAVVLFAYGWWAPVLLTLAWLVSNGWYRGEMADLVASFEGSAPGFRRAAYLSDLALGGAAAKEIRLFGLARWLTGRFEEHWWRALGQATSKRQAHRWGAARSALVLVASHGVVLGLLARSALRGEIAVGDLAVHAQAVLGLAGFAWDFDEEYRLRLGAAPFPHALRIPEAVKSPRFQLPGSQPPPAARRGIRFRAVAFAYPGTERRVLEDVDLWLPAGTSLAIVGDNGSGKTTLMKLLCRFYDPTHGSIEVDGTDLRAIEASGWQSHIAAMFQDFGRYPLSVRDNVAFGCLARYRDEASLDRAAALAGCAPFVERLPGGWETPMSRQFRDGIEPSGGQWQRLALARVLLAVDCGAQMLLLDEPTANLDIRAEAAFYERFLDLTRGLTTILVSHRFSTVRQAERIAVLSHGRIIELGTHDELMSLNRTYASMFRLQAERYLEASHA
ncbi:MAG: ABC transporter ATP-binding protein/permease [Actinomycetota bacterium]|nr:ABC transporter ATP-binding protein/permease [Actinomycetota bacterium]